MEKNKDIQVSEAMRERLQSIQTDAATRINQIQAEAGQLMQQITEAYILGAGFSLDDGFELSNDFKTIKRK